MNRRHFFEQLTAALAVPAVAAPVPAITKTPVDFPPWLAAWRHLPQHLVWSSDDPTALALIAAAKEQRPLILRYHSGSTPGALRRFTPSQVFRVADSASAPLYLNGWCHERQQHRTLRLDRVTLALAPLFEPAIVS